MKYQNKRTAADASPTAVWIDTALHFVIKWQGTDTSAGLRNITEGTQAADLFVVPSAYEILKPMKKAAKMPSK